MCLLFSADTQHLSVRTEDVSSEQQEWGSSLDQDDPPEPRHIKEEQEETWSSPEAEQLQLNGLGEDDDDDTKFALTTAPVKSDDEGSGGIL